MILDEGEMTAESGFIGKEPQINADERRYKPITDLCAAHRKVRKERKAQPQFRTRMTRIARIFADTANPRASASSASSAQSVFHHVCSFLKNPAYGVSAFITPKPCGFSRPKPNGSRLPNNTYALAGHTWTRPPEAQLWVPSTPRTRIPAGICGHALQRRISGRHHQRFFKNMIFQTGLTGYVFNLVHPVILSNSKFQGGRFEV